MPIATILRSEKDTVRPRTHTHITAPASSAGKRFTTGLTERRTTGTARGAAGPALNAERIHTWDNPARVEEPAPAELPVRRWGITFTGSRRPKLSTRIIITRTAPAAGSTSERGAMEQGSTATELEKRVRNAR